MALIAMGSVLAGEPPAAARPSKPSPGTIEGAVISPYQSANVGCEVSGVIDAFHFNEGDAVKKGDVVVEISRRRYGAISHRAAASRDARRVELEGLKKEEQVKDRLLELHGTTQLVAQDAESKRAAAMSRLKEADEELRLAEINVDECQVKAPFSGHIAVRYKQPHEPADRLEKLFAVVDTSKVYAVGNLSEDALDQFKVGTRAAFVRAAGDRREGTVERMAKLIDPQSRTKRVYVLIDNAHGDLEVGMTGTIEKTER